MFFSEQLFLVTSIFLCLVWKKTVTYNFKFPCPFSCSSHVICTHFVITKNSIDVLDQIKIKWNNYIRFAACFLVLMTPNNKRAPSAVSFSFGYCYFIYYFYIFTSTKG